MRSERRREVTLRRESELQREAGEVVRTIIEPHGGLSESKPGEIPMHRLPGHLAKDSSEVVRSVLGSSRDVRERWPSVAVLDEKRFRALDGQAPAGRWPREQRLAARANPGCREEPANESENAPLHLRTVNSDPLVQRTPKSTQLEKPRPIQWHDIRCEVRGRVRRTRRNTA
jgi:hypothetical protein